MLASSNKKRTWHRALTSRQCAQTRRSPGHAAAPPARRRPPRRSLPASALDEGDRCSGAGPGQGPALASSAEVSERLPSSMSVPPSKPQKHGGDRRAGAAVLGTWGWMPSTSRRSHTSSYATCTCSREAGAESVAHPHSQPLCNACQRSRQHCGEIKMLACSLRAVAPAPPMLQPPLYFKLLAGL